MKKNISIWILSLSLLASIGYTATVTRADLYHAWGPMLMESIVRVLEKRDDAHTAKTNELVAFANAHGGDINNLPEIGLQNFMNAVSNELATLQPYPWMSE